MVRWNKLIKANERAEKKQKWKALFQIGIGIYQLQETIYITLSSLAIPM